MRPTKIDGERIAETLHRFTVVAKGSRSRLLLTSLVGLLLIYPFLDASLYHRVIRGLLNGLILASAAFAVGRSLRVLVIAVLLAGPAIAMQASVIANGEEGMVELWYLASAMFYAFTVAQVLAYVLRQGAVSSEKICAAISAYLLLGLLWTSIYAFIDAIVPGSFAIAGASDAQRPLAWVDFLFFSFTTLTTTGYGNIVPLTPHAQSMSIVEQLAGTFFIAILIARLAGLYDPGTRPPPRKGPRR